MTHQVRQGDVFLQQIPRLPPQVTPIPSVDGRIVLAYGEVTGHAHAVTAESATLFEDESGNRYLEVQTATELLHEEHGEAALFPVTYRVRRQREYTPAAPRWVVD